MTNTNEMTGTSTIIKHNLPRPEGLIECASVLDIGAGIRPMNWYTPKEHHCVEPHAPYVKVLMQHGYDVWIFTALDVLSHPEVFETDYEAIYLLDVIEHMEKEEGFEVIALASDRAKKQVVIYTPTGFMEQTHDEWGLGGEEWQTHKSGWMPEEFAGWDIQFHGKGFFAVLTK